MDEPRTILVVDDELPQRILLRASLTDAGHDVCEAASGREALKLMRERPVDLVLLDLVMPEMDGFQFLKQLKGDNLLRDVPVVVVSGSEDMESVTRCISMGATDHLSKPFDPLLLHTRVRSSLAIRQVQVEQERRRLAGRAVAHERVDGEKPEAAESQVEADESRMGLRGLARSLARMGRPYRRRVALFGVLMLASVAIQAALPLGFKFITDFGLIPHDLRVLLLVLAVLLVATLVLTALEILRDYAYAALVARVLTDVRHGLYRQLQNLSVGFYARTSPGEITSRFTTDLASVEEMLVGVLPYFAPQLVMVVFGFGILAYLEPKLAAFAIVGMYVCFKTGQAVEPRASSASRELKMAQAAVTNVVQENVLAQPVVKMFQLQGLMIENFKHRMLGLVSTGRRAVFLLFLSNRVPNRVIQAYGLITIGIGAVLTYEHLLTIGELITFQVVLTGLIDTVAELIWAVPHLTQAAVGLERIEEILDAQPDVADAPDASPLPRFSDRIELQGVRFGYSPGRLNLDDVSMTVRRGQSVLLVGPSGCGKSTVLNLLMRFYDPQSGTVSIDGRDLQTVTQDSLRQQLSVVLQENFLFNTTIRDNIRMGRRDASDAEVEEAARAAEIHDVITAMPDGYATSVGERGGRLSGGQRQRVAIARAILSNPSVLLLDEATSALDPATEGALNRSLERIGRGRTVVSVTHRLDTAPAADCIFVFRDGRLVEQGSHQELLRHAGVYAALVRKQGGFEVSDDGHRATIDPDRLRDIPILATLDDSLRSMVASLFATERFGPGRIVVHQGDVGDRFYVIVRGRVAVSRAIGDGSEQHIAVLEDGDHFGEIALLNRVPRTATVRTLSDCIFLTLTTEHFLRLLETDSGLRATMQRTLSERLGGEREVVMAGQD